MDTIKAQLAKEFSCQESEIEIKTTNDNGQIVCELNLQNGNLRMTVWAMLSKNRKRVLRNSGGIYSWYNSQTKWVSA